ncbi:hypothetical protein IWQ57_000500 [Coemansia nantahalensis]|uniref:Uncharacterized protein n=1 Tax=Coemansia nantahalensis TaxID=2789366 RepID=A0ACC1K7R4_9FUNG|nr:hypothetical protein IWQ57_000500 [Coemansia nantahalensis]
MAATDSSAFAAFEAYDFDNDEEFQAGLRTLPSSAAGEPLLRAKVFYYSTAVAPIDLAQYQEWKSAQHSLTFAEVAGMILRGETVPGIRQIPDAVSDQPPSTSTARAPPKPWETRSPGE